MGIKRYILLSLIFIAIVGIFVFSQIENPYTMNIGKINLTLPVAIWVIFPLIALFLATLFHLFYYWMKNLLKEKRLEKDLETLRDSVYQAILREPKIYPTKEKKLEEIVEAIGRGVLDIKEKGYDFKDKKIKKAVEIVSKIEKGEYIEKLKEITDINNPLYVKNILNRLDKERDFSTVILSKKKEYSPEIRKKAIFKFIEYAEINKIKNYKEIFDLNVLFELLKRAKKTESFKINIYDLKEIIMAIKNLSGDDFVNIAKEIKEIFLPEDRLKLFEELKNINEKSQNAYFYTLLDLEMIQKATEELENFEENEFLAIRAFLELKKCGKNYNLELFL